MSDVTVVKEGWVQKRGKYSPKPRVVCLVSVLMVSGVLEVGICSETVHRVADSLCPVREKGYLTYMLGICLLFRDSP